MSNDTYDDPFGTQPVTPGYNTYPTKGSYKLLVVIFVVDCSKTMHGERIGAVNAALQELKFKLREIKDNHSLELKAAIMSFASGAKWELQLTPIEEVILNTIHTRPGLTEYGAAFHELNKVLQKEAYMKHVGKVAPPAIMFLTDGEPEDDYQADLDELLRNPWFMNASRSAVLLGDAIHNQSARNAVSQFVNDADRDIVTADDSTVIIQKIRLATMHTVAGDPIQDVPQDSIRVDMGDPFDGLGGNDTDPVGDISLAKDDQDVDDPSGAGSIAGDLIDGITGCIDNPFGDDDDLFNNLI